MDEIKLLVLRLTERCNLRCAYCYAARGGESFDMDEDTALAAVALCCPVGGTLRIQFTGGEPLLRLDLMEAVARFGRETGRKLVLSAQTNGTLLTPAACRRLRAICCGIGVSLDGLGTANALRVFPDGSASGDAVVQGIQTLGAAGIRCGLTAVVTSANASRLGELAGLALWLGNAAGVGLDLFRPLGRGAGQELSSDPEELAQGLRTLKSRAEALSAAGIPFHFRELERIRRRKSLAVCPSAYCYAQTGLSLAVDGRGDCWPCSSLAGQEGCFLGNIRDGLPQRTSGQRSALSAPAQCRSCSGYPLCLGGCPAGRLESEHENRLTCLMHRVLAGKEIAP